MRNPTKERKLECTAASQRVEGSFHTQVLDFIFSFPTAKVKKEIHFH